ncbi:methyltransferase domain-containing protein [Salaquimonas pukyongi]|uniref:methyltransferase domain-containing protein n=1 Tax=Salaquimonas pukyongi TaxID=2712698 RepID=UPI0012EBCF19|nr:methyltransferase domain-containing protein [Salaquimonas pukyongi]
MDSTMYARRRQQLTERAARIAMPGADFLHGEAAGIVGERLAAINRRFEKPALLFDGPFAANIGRIVCEAGAPIDGTFSHVAWPKPGKTGEILPMEPQSADLIVSVFDLQRVADPAAMLLQINHALVPDGLFMAVLPAAGFLAELRQALIETELSLREAAAARVDHFRATSEIGNLLQQAGFKLVVSDLEERDIRYRDVKHLLGDIRAAGAASLQSTSSPALPKKALSTLENVYGKLAGTADGRIQASARMAFATGWKHAANQQQPSKPGSATHRLQDYLKKK